jgi:phenylacetate-CoA ligase
MTLERALAEAPFYHRWKDRDPGPARPLEERFAAMPVLTKRDVRSHVPDGFMWAEQRAGRGLLRGEAEIVTTSGTSGDRLSVVWHQPWWDRSEREASRIHATLDEVFAKPHREAVLTTRVCGSSACHAGNASMAERTLGTLLFLNQSNDPSAWDARTATRMADELEAFAPEVIEADPAYLAIFCRMSIACGRALPLPRCIVLTYEYPSILHYRWIRRAFPGVPVISSYGSTETGHVLTQCEHGTFHQNMATCRIDIQPLRADKGGAGIARLLVTTLGNPWFTLVRFDIGDLVRVQGDTPCPCGRTEGLTVAGIEGRWCDLTFDARGCIVTVGRLDRALGSIEALTGYQVFQPNPRSILARYSSDEGENGAVAEALVAALTGLYGSGVDIQARRERAIPPEQSGKFRLARAAVLPAAEAFLP